MAATWCGTSCRNVSEKNRQAVQGAAKCVWHCGWHSYCMVWQYGEKPQCYTPQVPEDMKAGKLKALQRQIPLLVYRHTIPWKVILQSGVMLHERKVQALTAIPPPKFRKELQWFLGIINTQVSSHQWLLRYVNPYGSLHWGRQNGLGMVHISSYVTRPRK